MNIIKKLLLYFLKKVRTIRKNQAFPHETIVQLSWFIFTIPTTAVNKLSRLILNEKCVACFLVRKVAS